MWMAIPVAINALPPGSSVSGASTVAVAAVSILVGFGGAALTVLADTRVRYLSEQAA